MLKGKELIGRDIIALSNGERVERVRDIVFDHHGNQVLALLVDEGGWFSSAKAIPFECVKSIGENAVMISSPEQVTSTRENGMLKDALESKVTLVGTRLITTEGQDLGRIADVYFDEETGRVVGYEATEGLFSDLSNGRTFIPAPENIQIGKDTAIVPIDVANAMQEQDPKGLRGVLHNAGNAVKQTVDNITEGSAERQKEFVIGKTAGSDIQLEDGSYLVHKGEVITQRHAELAEWHGKLRAMEMAAIGGVITGTYQAATGKVQETFESVREASVERQKEFVVGKTAGGDIQLEDGSYLIRKGEIITAAHADAAEKQGKLLALGTAATSGVISEQVENMRGASAERQKEFVVGKVAGSEVRSEAGELIVLKDAIITQFQAEHAERVGALGALTAAAITGNVGSTMHSVQERRELDPNSLEATIGRRVRSDVRSSSGSLVAVQGQIVTQAVADRAQHLGVADKLIAATKTEGMGIAAPASMGQAGAVLNTDVSALGSNIASSAGGLLDRAKQWIGEKREEAESAIQERQEHAEEQRIRKSLGRPVTRVILAPDDSVILNVGEIVTNAAIHAAMKGEVLDILLDSVSHEEISINNIESRPAVRGAEALPEGEKKI